MAVLENKKRIGDMATKLTAMAQQLAELYAEIERTQTAFGVMTTGLNDGAPATLRGRFSGLKDHVGIARNSANGIAAGLIEYANSLGR